MSQIEQLSLLIKKLREEHIYVNSEKRHLVELHRQVLKKAEQLFRKTWIISYQRILLNDLLFGRALNTNNLANLKLILNQYCSKFTNLNKKANFIESYKVLSYNDYKISEFLKHLRENPKYLAQFLVKCEKLSSSADLNIQYLIPIIFSSLYANGLLINDEQLVLQLLKNLIEIQFLNDNVDLRRLIRKQSCSFNIVFKYFTEFVFSTRLFLTAALHEPILQLLMQDEWYYDIDPEKALVRFSPEERQKRFGDPNSKDYKIKIQKHREFIVNKLYTFTMAFIDSINSNLFCFPASLGWLVSHIYNLLTKSTPKSTIAQQQQQQHEARKLCCDLIMALYICPAICDPEPYGVISDIPISVYARHNLMQIAHILQVLAMYDDKEPKTQDLYSKFRSNCVSDILNTIIISNSHENYKFYLNTISSPSDATSTSSLSLQSTSTSSAYQMNNILLRTSMIVTLQDINKLILFVHHISKDLDKECEEYRWVKNILPTEYLNTLFDAQQQQKIDLNSQLDTFMKTNQKPNNQNSIKNKKLSNETSLNDSSITESIAYDLTVYLESLKVLIININDKSFDCPGMLSEEKVLQEYEYINASSTSLLKHNSKRNIHKNKNNKKILSLDDRSSSDKLENMNNQSISSSNDDVDDVDDVDDDVMNANDDDDENENEACMMQDGLSEFNFSGRDTPIISGRDTPSSYSHEDLRRISSNINNQINNSNMANSNINNNNNNNINNNMNMNNNLSRLPVTVQKENREDINDKFCKFEINKVNAPVKEEQLSEAWSLDADPPESVVNEPIGDDQLSTISGFLSNTRPIQASQSVSSSSNQVPLINISSSYSNNQNDNLQFSTNRAESITSDVCSESALSEDRYLNNNNNNNISDNEQFNEHQQQYSITTTPVQQLIRNNNPITSIIDAISSKFDLPNLNQQQSLLSTTSTTTCVINTLTTNTQTYSKNKNPFSIFTNSKQQQQQQQNTLKSTTASALSNNNNNSQKKKTFGSLFGKSKSNKLNDESYEEQIITPSTVTTSIITSQGADDILKKYSQTSRPVSQIQESKPVVQELLIQIDDVTPSPPQQPAQTTSTMNNLSRVSSISTAPPIIQNEFYDSANFEQSKAFQDAKKKLRIVLSLCDFNHFNSLKSINYLGSNNNKENFLTMFLKAQLYEAISLQDTEKEARLDEAMRCVQIFNDLECNKLIKSLKSDYKNRIYYISYLTKSKQNLLYSNSFLEKLIQRTDSQHKLCNYHLTSVVTRLYLETKENQIQKFIQQFKILVALDEKFDLYKQFIKQLNIDFDQIWQMCTNEEIDYAHLFIERLIMARVYTYAIYPNGEIDNFRDRKTYECLQNLGNKITPSHPLIAIPAIYHNEAPWNAAQVELKRLNAYKTPQDKLNCIRKCMDAIQNLLSIAKAPVCADDIQPVLTYVIIKANPTAFLSTVQYIEGFYGKQLDQEFYWSQFLFAFSYIKAELLKNSE